jgi:hypothetical protein
MEDISFQEDINFQEVIDYQNYQQDDDYRSDVFSFQEQKSFGGRKKTRVWEYFDTFGERKHGHVGCICKACNWKRSVGKAGEMVDHLALSCPRVSNEVRQYFLEEVRKRPALKLNHDPSNNNNETAAKKAKTSQKKITSIFESSELEESKIVRCNRALTRLFVCCGIPFSVVSNPFFIDFVKSLCPAYELPDRVTLAGSWMNQELVNILTVADIEVRSSGNITLGLDGWCDPNGRSIYAFILILPSGKEYIHSLKNLSLHSHTADFISKEILKVIEDVGAENFSSVVSDNASTMVKAKRLVNEKYPHIIPVRCITHHINLLTNDIMKHEFSRLTISKCMKIVKYFHQSYKAGALLSEDIKKNLIDGGGLKGYCKTRWTTAFDCLASILRCESSLHNVLENYPETLSSEIKDLLRNRIFYQDVEELVNIIKPIKEVLTSLEYKTTTLSDCFIQLIKLGIMIKCTNLLNSEFRLYCLEKFNLRWSQFDFKLYLLGYFFHPSYRGKGLKEGVFRQIVHWSVEILINNINGGINSASELVLQMADYKDFQAPYEYKYKPGYKVESWWAATGKYNSWIGQIALIINSITPHNVGCERVFSVLGWMCTKRRSRLSTDRMETMAKLHSYYVSNASKEMNYAFSGLKQDEFLNELNKSFNEITEFSEDEIEDQEKEYDRTDEEEDLDQNNEETLNRGNEIILDKYFDVDAELQKALEVDVRIVIEKETVPVYDHGEKEFDIDELLNSTLNG